MPTVKPNLKTLRNGIDKAVSYKLDHPEEYLT